ncbi:MAG TPA: pyrroloquinoline quinone precursor peptide PqqA [Acetobacteraceae bacterium]|nr:pyrroloquinoline quinone precursor peptide PqqA [Acetobacteraceae bacterium]
MLDQPPKSVLPFGIALAKWAPLSKRATPLKETIMAWTRPKLREICIGLEINGYMAGAL